MNKIDFLLKGKCGIYCIFNMENGKRYVGSSVDIYNRLHEHVHNLKRGDSHNQHLQNAWDKYGESKFIYGILEFCDSECRFDREQFYISQLRPEYNLTFNVVANFGHSVSLETKQKISNTLKDKYASGEIIAYRQNHNWRECWLYTIDYQFVQKFDNMADLCTFLNYKKGSGPSIFHTLINDKYCVFSHELKPDEIENEIDKQFKKYRNGQEKYLIVELQAGSIRYCRTAIECAQIANISKSAIFKHANSTINNPYQLKKSNIKIYFSDKFIRHGESRSFEESKELSSGNIGEMPEKENPEINLESNDSKSSYSVEGETL